MYDFILHFRRDIGIKINRRYVEFHDNVIRMFFDGLDGRFYFYVWSFHAVAQNATEINDPGDETYFYRQACRREKLRLSCKYRSLARISFRVNVALNRSLTSALSGRSSWSAVEPDDARINTIR